MSTSISETHPAEELHSTGEHTHPTDTTYFKVAAFLFVVTAAEVAVYYIDLSTAALLGLLMPMMIVKFAVVVLFFMHLRFDSKVFRRLFIAGLLLAAAVYAIALSTFHFWA